MDKKVEQIEKITKQIETEKDFDKVITLFSEAASLVKEVLKQGEQARGRVLEIVRELDDYIEREIKVGD